MDAGVEDASCEVEPAFFEADGHTHEARRVGAFFKGLPHCAERLVIREAFRGKPPGTSGASICPRPM